MLLRALVIVSALATGAAADVMDDIRARGEMVLGFRTDAPPFSVMGELGEPEGLAVLLCREAAKAVRRELALEALPVRYEAVSAADRFAALAEGRIDILCGPTSATLARRETLDFSIPYFVDGSSVVYRTGIIETIEDLSSERVGVLGGTTTEAVARDVIADRAPGAELVAYASHVAGLTALERGEVAAYFGDQAILRYQLGQLRPKAPLKFSADQFSFEPYALAMKRGESRLRLTVDRALSETFRSGAIFTHVQTAMGEVTLSDLAFALYQVSALPE